MNKESQGYKNINIGYQGISSNLWYSLLVGFLFWLNSFPSEWWNVKSLLAFRKGLNFKSRIVNSTLDDISWVCEKIFFFHQVMGYTHICSTSWVHPKTVTWESSQGVKRAFLSEETIYLYNKDKYFEMNFGFVLKNTVTAELYGDC